MTIHRDYFENKWYTEYKRTRYQGLGFANKMRNHYPRKKKKGGGGGRKTPISEKMGS